MRAASAPTCLPAAVVGSALGRAAWTDGHRTAENIARHRHTVTATTLGETTYRAGDQPSSRPATVATATWHCPPQCPHTETVPVPAGTRPGDTVRPWADANGTAAAAPPGRAETALNAVGIGTRAPAGIVPADGALRSGRLRPVQGAGDG
ncbi:hypothetical protein [Streptomyces lavendulae]|uniref:hypothetical protein n=1 Tax=Streptomyces lavendulae TaxID=1914 RepID=UPI003693CF85